ncbi:hypothetical protein BDV29DRAFT_171877 [Aspergillus leporis]|uniref:CFEM domain-containing protein n=1 Tax=Aspergillus leporis TaxID=41062 RepID=A0A5N5X891_9EURO|nr:hypothetical protein BDV29DRAFT_171877 [Aspergillus leporis]
MKTTILSMVLLAAASMVGADVSVGECAQMCIGNMNNKASELGCSSGDLACLCKSDNYAFGVRDCTAQACPNDDSAAVVSAALAACPSGSMSPMITPLAE